MPWQWFFLVPASCRLPIFAQPLPAYFLATVQELGARLTGGEPLVSRSQVNLYYGKVQTMNINKARQELGYAPRPPEQALRESFAYLQAGAFVETPQYQMVGG